MLMFAAYWLKREEASAIGRRMNDQGSVVKRTLWGLCDGMKYWRSLLGYLRLQMSRGEGSKHDGNRAMRGKIVDMCRINFGVTV
jgi:hypothetical protein